MFWKHLHEFRAICASCETNQKERYPTLSKNEEENGGGSGSRVVTIGSMTHFENSLLFFFEVESLFFSLLLLQGV